MIDLKRADFLEEHGEVMDREERPTALVTNIARSDDAK